MVFAEVAKTGEVPDGTMKHVERGGTEIVLVNVDGTIYALGDRCAHMNAPLSMGRLDGHQIICPLHFSRFDVRTGKKISGPVEAALPGVEKLPPEFLQALRRMAEVMAPVKTHDQPVYRVRVEGQKIYIDM
jgi:nitrite reductase/ring-hydroxylating ferredoxin subunit